MIHDRVLMFICLREKYILFTNLDDKYTRLDITALVFKMRDTGLYSDPLLTHSI